MHCRPGLLLGLASLASRPLVGQQLIGNPAIQNKASEKLIWRGLIILVPVVFSLVPTGLPRWLVGQVAGQLAQPGWFGPTNEKAN